MPVFDFYQSMIFSCFVNADYVINPGKARKVVAKLWAVWMRTSAHMTSGMVCWLRYGNRGELLL